MAGEVDVGPYGMSPWSKGGSVFGARRQRPRSSRSRAPGVTGSDADPWNCGPRRAAMVAYPAAQDAKMPRRNEPRRTWRPE